MTTIEQLLKSYINETNEDSLSVEAKWIIEELAQRLVTTHNSLRQIYPAIAGRYIGLMQSGEDRAADDWKIVVDTIYNIIQGKA